MNNNSALKASNIKVAKTYELPRRLDLIDISRGFAAIIVLIYHWNHFFGVGASSSDPSDMPFHSLLQVIYNNGGVAVEYFFLMSGFIFFWLYKDKIVERKIDFIRFTKARIARIFPLHLLMLFSVVVLQFIYYSLFSETYIYQDNSVVNFFLNLTLMQSWGVGNPLTFNGPSWSISVEMFLYFSFFLLAYFRWLNLLTCVFIVALALLGVKYFLFKGVTMFFMGGGIWYLTPYFLNFKRCYYKFLFLFVITLWICSFNYSFMDFDILSITNNSSRLSRLYMNYLLLPLTLITLITLEVRFGLKLKLFKVLGDISYSCYLIHFPVQIILAIIINLYFSSFNLIGSQVLFFLWIPSILGLSYFIHHKFEMPMQSLIRNMSWKL